MDVSVRRMTVNASNGTTSSMDLRLFEMQIKILTAQHYLWCLVSCIGIPGNILTILVVAKNRRLQTTSNVLLAALAIADLAVGITGVVVQLLRERVQICNTFYDVTLEIFTTAPILSAASHILLVAVDRYIAIVYPLRYGAIITTSLIKKVVVFIWLFFFSLTSTFLVWAARNRADCFALVPFQHNMSMYCILYVSTAFFMVFMYTRIMLIAKKHAKEIQPMTSPGGTWKANERNNRTRMLYYILAAYFIAWSPYLVLISVQTYAAPKSYHRQLALLIALTCSVQLGVANSAINFFIYAWKSKVFRKGYLELILRRGATSAQDVNNTAMRETQTKGHIGLKSVRRNVQEAF